MDEPRRVHVDDRSVALGEGSPFCRRARRRSVRACLLAAIVAACGHHPEDDVRGMVESRTRLLALPAHARAAGVPQEVGTCADLAAMEAAHVPASTSLGEPVSFAVVERGAWSEVRAPVRCVLASREEWNALRGWAGFSNASAGYPGPPTGAMLVVGSLGTRPRAGEEIVIDSVWRRGDTLTVGTRRIGTGVGEALTHPFVVVEVPAAAHVRFLEP